MNLIRRANTFHIQRRVPSRYAPVEERKVIWISLHTDSESVAKTKAPAVWADLIEAWEYKLVGRSDDAFVRIAAAKDLAARRGFQYLPIEDVARLASHDLLARIEAMLTAKASIDPSMMEAVLGARAAPPISLSRALNQFWRVADERTLGISADQIRRWRNPRIKAFGAFIEVVGAKSGLTKTDTLRLRVPHRFQPTWR